MRYAFDKKRKKADEIEPTSYLWHRLLSESRIPLDGVIIEVAPGYEPKIGNALALMGFRGAIILVEPDKKAAYHIWQVYRRILPLARVSVLVKPLQDVEVGMDVPVGADVLVASHPFDDMVISCAVRQTAFFSREKDDGAGISASVRKLYSALRDQDYAHGTQRTIDAWRNFIARSKPACFIASQYPSRTLEVKGLTKRQASGFIVLRELKKFYKNSLYVQKWDKSFGYKGDLRWWIVARKPSTDSAYDLKLQPLAMQRLGESLFVPQRARCLHPSEYDIVYVDDAYFKQLKYDADSTYIRNFAIVLDAKAHFSPKTVLTYADRQKDRTDVGLCGNEGSGRAVYYGDRFNVLGVGRTTLCKSTVPSHSTGRAEFMGAARRLILSKWVNHFTQRAVEHPVLIVLKEAARYKWNPRPIPLALLVRVDDGSLDRPSHIEYAPHIPINFKKTLIEYARLDAEYFAYRILFGAWSTGNYSLDGRLIDLESASFVKYRGPYHTASAKHQENLFGYEGLGFLKILRLLADIKYLESKNIKNRFYLERRRHLGRCFLSLLGIADDLAADFFSKHQKCVVVLSNRFERLAKKICPPGTSLNLYTRFPDDQDPSLLDMSGLFRNLANIYRDCLWREEAALDHMVRKTALVRATSEQTHNGQKERKRATDQAGAFIREHAVVTPNSLHDFMRETRDFIHALFQLLDLLDAGGCLAKKLEWNDRLGAMNQDLPVMFELNDTLRHLAEAYRLKKMSPKTLGVGIEKLCKLPKRI